MSRYLECIHGQMSNITLELVSVTLCYSVAEDLFLLKDSSTDVTEEKAVVVLWRKFNSGDNRIPADFIGCLSTEFFSNL